MSPFESSKPSRRARLVPWAGALTLLGLGGSMLLPGPWVDIAMLLSLLGFAVFLWAGRGGKDEA